MVRVGTFRAPQRLLVRETKAWRFCGIASRWRYAGAARHRRARICGNIRYATGQNGSLPGGSALTSGVYPSLDIGSGVSCLFSDMGSRWFTDMPCACARAHFHNAVLLIISAPPGTPPLRVRAAALAAQHVLLSRQRQATFSGL